MEVLVGVLAGVLSGLFGIGGGIIIVPALLVFKRMSPERATGTSLTALLLPVGALAVWHYYRQGFVDVRSGIWLALGIFLGAYVGARLGTSIPAREVQRGFAVLHVLVAIHLWVKAA